MFRKFIDGIALRKEVNQTHLFQKGILIKLEYKFSSWKENLTWLGKKNDVDILHPKQIFIKKCFSQQQFLCLLASWKNHYVFKQMSPLKQQTKHLLCLIYIIALNLVITRKAQNCLKRSLFFSVRMVAKSFEDKPQDGQLRQWLIGFIKEVLRYATGDWTRKLYESVNTAQFKYANFFF